MKLLELWSQAGHDPDQFWRQTPRTLSVILAGYRARRRIEIEAFTYQARLAAVLGRWPRDKYLPALDELLKPPRPAGRQPVSEMLEAFREMKAAGAPIKIRKLT